MSFDAALAFIAKWEGGFVDDKHDPGGVTKWGITIRTLISKGLDLNNDGAVNRKDIIAMTPKQARAIYRRDYWIGSACPLLPAPLALLQFDCAVNQGTGRAARILQKTVRTKADGIIGPATRAAVERAWADRPLAILGEYCARRAVHYSSLSLVVRYGLGWFRRLFDAHRAALQLPATER